MVFLEKFSFTSSCVFLLKMQKKNVFEDKWFWSKKKYQNKIQANTNWSSHLKNIKHLIFSNDIYFHVTEFSKIAVFRDF